MLGVVLAFVLALLGVIWWRSRSDNLPPSPGLALPMVGHLHLIKGDFVDQLHRWRRRLGDIYTIQLGPFRYVVLNGYDVISETYATHHENLLERPHNFPFGELFQHKGILALGGRQWKEQRAFLQATLRSLGMSRNIMAERIRVEADYLLDIINGCRGQATDVSNMVMLCVTNVICGVSFGKRFSQDDEFIVNYLDDVKRGFELLGSAAVVNFFPMVKYLPGDLFHYRELKAIFIRMSTGMMDLVERDKIKVNLSDQAIEDVSQAFLTEIKRKESQGVVDTSFTDRNLQCSLVSLFNGGSETTTNTIVFALVYMVNFPQIQTRLYQEIKDEVGTDRAPDIADKKKLKFLTAFIMETQRFSGVVPISLDRLATSDFQLRGHTVRKGTCVMANLDSVLRDQRVWGDPQVFRPDRFLDDSGSVVTKKEFLPFGTGKRNCIGEGLAVMEFFIFISALVQKFEFFPEIKDQPPSMEPDEGFTRVAKPFKIRAVPRK
ncbi:cytochrome P450 2D6 [Elysia marginata]|uniref:Cytochrome P450 2D6 n=1 Tax=Elysia marginata TaxID=1093978 RepID=A0AAV4FYI6_9GAST|nr:cytochrome P450 2D6 [Elysia marginata]